MFVLIEFGLHKPPANKENEDNYDDAEAGEPSDKSSEVKPETESPTKVSADSSADGEGNFISSLVDDILRIMLFSSSLAGQGQ